MTMMAKLSDAEFTRRVVEDIIERDRVSQLSDVALVTEIIQKVPINQHTALIEEACTRLDPQWVDR